MDTNVTTTTDNKYVDHAYSALKLGYIVAPILMGLDKFFNLLTNWTDYLAPVFPSILNITPETFMQGVGIVEIVAGLGVALKPKVFGYVVSAWLVGIIVNLFILGNYYDVAVRDLGLAIGAFALGQLSTQHEHTHVKTKHRIGKRTYA